MTSKQENLLFVAGLGVLGYLIYKKVTMPAVTPAKTVGFAATSNCSRCYASAGLTCYYKKSSDGCPTGEAKCCPPEAVSA